MDSEEPKKVVLDGDRDWDIFLQLEEAIQRVWLDQGFTESEIASWSEDERFARTKAAYPLIKPPSQ